MYLLRTEEDAFFVTNELTKRMIEDFEDGILNIVDLKTMAELWPSGCCGHSWRKIDAYPEGREL